MYNIVMIVFVSEEELLLNTNDIVKCFPKDIENKVFLGSFGKVNFNQNEVLKAISDAVDELINKDNFKIIYLACIAEDASEIEKTLENKICNIFKVSYQEFLRYL